MKDLFDMGDPNELATQENTCDEHWVDMPEFTQKDKRPKRRIIVSFDNEQDVQSFATLIGAKISQKTKDIWFPFRPVEKSKVGYASNS